MIFDPKDDGITHINVYSKAKTELGKFLSNFSKCDLKTEDGDFQSVEGLWYFLQITDEYKFKDDLRSLSGKSANLKEFVESKLPFTHYYLMFGKQKFPDSKNDWVIEYLEEFRKECKLNTKMEKF
jgi:hypothetical protein